MSVSVFCDVACELGEGPSYDESVGALFWFDITGRKLLEKAYPDGPVRIHELPFMASAIAAIDGERQLVVGETGLHVRDRRTGRLTLHTEIEAGNPANRSNDSRVHPSGAFWIGTMPKDEATRTGSIYWFRDGELRVLFPGIAITNSICFAPDGSVAYYTDTADGRLMRVACDPESGLPRGEPSVFVDWRGQPGGLDGSVVDRDGVLWNARWGAGAVDAWSPDGERLRTIAVPATQSTCPAFVGPDASRMVVTSAWRNLDAAARAAQPDAGKTFLLDFPVHGRFEPRVRL